MKTKRSYKWGLTAVALTAMAGATTMLGCELLVDFDRSKIPQEAGVVTDGAPTTDSTTPVSDSSVADTSTGADDSAAADTGTDADTGAPLDSGVLDTGTADTGTSPADTGAPPADTGAPDTGTLDTGAPDTGDDGSVDASDDGG